MSMQPQHQYTRTLAPAHQVPSGPPSPGRYADPRNLHQYTLPPGYAHRRLPPGFVHGQPPSGYAHEQLPPGYAHEQLPPPSTAVYPTPAHVAPFHHQIPFPFTHPRTVGPLYHGHEPPICTYTDSAMTRLSNKIRRRCYNCCSTETATWHCSRLSPGKVLCNKCELFKRAHEQPRPEHIWVLRKRAPPTGSSIRARVPQDSQFISPPSSLQPASLAHSTAAHPYAGLRPETIPRLAGPIRWAYEKPMHLSPHMQSSGPDQAAPDAEHRSGRPGVALGAGITSSPDSFKSSSRSAARPGELAKAA